MRSIKVGFCIAYDWYLLKTCLPLIYKSADKICLSIDKDRISWNGIKFPFDELEFKKYIKEIDLEEKIVVYEDDFHKKDNSPGENEVLQRNKIAEFLGKDGWHIQLDCDEYFLNFDAFVSYLKELNFSDNAKINVLAPLLTLFKRIPDGYLYINPEVFEKIEYAPVATLNPDYKYGRKNGYRNHISSFLILHQSWGRTEEEIRMKLYNWGHVNDFDKETFVKMWMDCDLSNYQSYNNFHPFKKELWPSLALLSGGSMEEIIASARKVQYPISRWSLLLKNSLLISRLNSLVKKIFR